MHEITLLRHGRSAADDEGRFEGRYDSPLTEAGRGQARRLASTWKADGQRKYLSIIHSPLSRAMETAAIIAEAIGATMIEDKNLIERDSGQLAGLPKNEDTRKKYPIPAFTGPYDRIVNGTGESDIQLHARAMLALQSLMDKPAGRILVVSHGGILNALIRVMLGMPIPTNNAGAFFHFGDTGYLDLVYDRENHRCIVRALTQMTK